MLPSIKKGYFVSLFLLLFLLSGLHPTYAKIARHLFMVDDSGSMVAYYKRSTAFKSFLQNAFSQIPQREDTVEIFKFDTSVTSVYTGPKKDMDIEEILAEFRKVKFKDTNLFLPIQKAIEMLDDQPGILWIVTDNKHEPSGRLSSQEMENFYGSIKENPLLKYIYLLPLVEIPIPSGTRSTSRLICYGILVSSTPVSREDINSFDHLFRTTLKAGPFIIKRQAGDNFPLPPNNRLDFEPSFRIEFAFHPSYPFREGMALTGRLEKAIAVNPPYRLERYEINSISISNISSSNRSIQQRLRRLIGKQLETKGDEIKIVPAKANVSNFPITCALSPGYSVRGTLEAEVNALLEIDLDNLSSYWGLDEFVRKRIQKPVSTKVHTSFRFARIYYEQWKIVLSWGFLLLSLGIIGFVLYLWRIKRISEIAIDEYPAEIHVLRILQKKPLLSPQEDEVIGVIKAGLRGLTFISAKGEKKKISPAGERIETDGHSLSFHPFRQERQEKEGESEEI